jgi:type I restriction enzyme S subunit
MEKLKNIPSLRFPEFEGEWEVKKLGEVANVSKLAGYEFTKHITYEESGKIIALRGLNIKNNNLDLTDVKYIDNSELSKLERSKLFVDDLMFTYIGTIGEVALIKENDKFYLAPNVSRIRVDKNNILPIYILQFFNQDKFRNDEIAKYISSSSQPALSMESVRKFQIKFPSLPEQTKIASFLTAVDEKLQALKQKKTLLEQYKKGVMQKIFSQELRFKPAPSEISGDDTSTTLSAGNGNEYPDWEETKVKDIFVVTRGNVLSMNLVTKEQDENNLFPVYSSQTKNNGLSGYYDKFLFEDCITWTTDGAGAGDVNFRKGKFYCTNVCGVLKSDKGYANTFVAEILNSVSRKYVSYVGNPKLMNNVMSEIQISIPTSIEEQTKIATFLSAIDDKISHCGVQIEKMEVWKKGLLQQMFC